MNEVAPAPQIPRLKQAAWAFAGVVAGIAASMVLLIAVEAYSAVVHPFPPDFQQTEEEIVAHVARYPQWVLATVVPMWAITAYASTWVARRIGGRAAAIIVGLLQTVAMMCNLSMLPYPTWFKVVMVIAIPAAIVMAVRQTKSRP